MTGQASDSTREVQLVFAPRGGLEKTEFEVKEFSTKVDETKRIDLRTTKYLKY